MILRITLTHLEGDGGELLNSMIRFEMLYEINLTFGLCIKFPRLCNIPVNRPIARVKGLKICLLYNVIDSIFLGNGKSTYDLK